MTQIDNGTKNDVMLRGHQSTLDLVILDRQVFSDLLRMADRYIQRVRERGNISMLTEADLLVIGHAIHQMLELVEFSAEMEDTHDSRNVQ